MTIYAATVVYSRLEDDDKWHLDMRFEAFDTREEAIDFVNTEADRIGKMPGLHYKFGRVHGIDKRWKA